MADDGLGPIDVTGRWVGFYRHRCERLGTFPITAEIRHEGDRITGEMYDQITDRSELLDTIVEAHRDDLSPGNRLRLEAAIRRFGDGAVMVNSRLPETSHIEGTVAGGLVEFTKAYRGALEVEWSVDGRGVGSARGRGTRSTIPAAWTGRGGASSADGRSRGGACSAGSSRPRARGTFELYKKS